MAIYTGKGDRGKTGLPGKRRKPKSDLIFETLGLLDQTSASVGVAVSHLDKNDKNIKKILQNIQSDLLNIGICLASEKPSTHPFINELPSKIKGFEDCIDMWEEEMGELKNFIIVGGNSAGSSLHFARTISRQAERSFHKLWATKPLKIARYLNRLSDLLFQSARYVNFQNKSIEPNWNKFQNTGKNS